MAILVGLALVQGGTMPSKLRQGHPEPPARRGRPGRGRRGAIYNILVSREGSRVHRPCLVRGVGVAPQCARPAGCACTRQLASRARQPAGNFTVFRSSRLSAGPKNSKEEIT